MPTKLIEATNKNAQTVSLEKKQQANSSTPPLLKASSYRLVPSNLAEVVRSRCSHLTLLQQRVLELYFFRGRRIVEVAQTCEISPSEVGSILALCMPLVHGAMVELGMEDR